MANACSEGAGDGSEGGEGSAVEPAGTGSGGGSEGAGGGQVLVAVEQSPAAAKNRIQLSLSVCFKRQEASWGSGGQTSTALVAASPSKPQMPVASSQIVLRRRAGRPKKAAGAPKQKYALLSGLQKAL